MSHHATGQAVTLALLGDVYFGPEPAPRLAPAVAEVLAEADLVLANQEGPIADRGEPVGGKACLRSTPAAAGILRDWGIDVVTLANNHVFDYGWEGFEDTRLALEEAGIAWLGAGRDLAEAARPLVRDVGGVRLGLLAASAETAGTRLAGEASFGCVPLDHEALARRTRNLRRETDAVVVLPHWGYCEYELPDPSQVVLAARLLDAGASLVAGHHSHLVQGITQPDGGLVAYSLGNFVFCPITGRGRTVPQGRDAGQGMILLVRLAEGRVVSYEAVFTVCRDGRIEVDDDLRRAVVLARRSKPLASPSYGRHWRWYVTKRLLRRVLHWANVLNWRKINRRTLAGGGLMLRHMLLARRPDKHPGQRDRAEMAGGGGQARPKAQPRQSPEQDEGRGGEV